MALALKNIIKTRANYRILTIMQGCGFSKSRLKRVHQEIFLFKDPSWASSHWTLAAFCIKSFLENPLQLLRTSN
jgi:hypothetical protein